MSLDRLFSASNISASGLSAERMRMEVVANNIANAFTTRTPQGGPYRRQDVVFSALLQQQIGQGGRPLGRGVHGRGGYGGVEVVGIIDDPADLPRIFQPGHPDADPEGFVQMPNVQIPLELVDLLTANRAYEANMKVLQAFRQQGDQALMLLRS